MEYPKRFFTFFSEFEYRGLCFFQPKTFSTSRRMVAEILGLIDAAVSKELGNKQTNNQTNNQTDSLTDWRFYRVMKGFDSYSYSVYISMIYQF